MPGRGSTWAGSTWPGCWSTASRSWWAAPSRRAGAAPAPTSGSPVVGLVNINTADETALESLPEVGPVTAQAIIDLARASTAASPSVDQLLDVDGIGDATLAKLTPYVTI